MHWAISNDVDPDRAVTGPYHSRAAHNGLVTRANACPCGTGRPYERCCGPLHGDEATADTAEALMRSRYAAFALGDAAYLLRSWHPATRPAAVELDPGQVWTRLRILATRRGGPDDSDGEVEFRAHFRVAGEPGTLSEQSRFSRVEGRWVYVGAASG
jgi:SEC-C motif-containing protein